MGQGPRLKEPLQIFRFAKGKHESMFKQRKNPRVIAWTQIYRRQHKKGGSDVILQKQTIADICSSLGVADQATKKKSRRTVKSQRGVAGLSLAELAAKRNETPAQRLEARQAAINKAKEAKKEKEAKAKKEKVSVVIITASTAGR